MTLEYAAVNQQRRRKPRVVKIAHQVAEKIFGQRSSRRRFKWMNANDHPQRLGRSPENLEVRLIQLAFDHLRRNLNSTKPQLRGAFQFFRGRCGILHRYARKRNEVIGVTGSQSRHHVIVDLRDRKTELGIDVRVHQKWNARYRLYGDALALHICDAGLRVRDRTVDWAHRFFVDQKKPAALAFHDPGREMLTFAPEKLDYLGRDEVVMHVDDIHRVLRCATEGWLQNEADLAVRAQRLVIEDSPSLADSQIVAFADKFVVVMSDIGIDRLVTHPMHREVSCHQDAIAVTSHDAHISYHPPGPRPWIFRPCRLTKQLLYARPNSHRVIRDDEQRISRISFGHVCRWYLVGCVFSKETLPLFQPPLVKQRGLLIEKVLHFLTTRQFDATHAAFLARFSWGSVMS